MQNEKRYSTSYDPKSAPQKLEHLIYKKKGNVAYVTINRPERLNALHTYAHQELNSVWKDIQRDPSMYVAILTGNGRAFCAGRDVKFLSEFQQKGELAPHEDPNNPAFNWGGGGQPRVAKLEKPVIAAINGLAVGVGMNIIMQCQLRVMADDAWLGDQHTNVGRFGAPQELYFNLPPATASYLSLCNGRLTAQAALSQGVVNVVVPEGEGGRGSREARRDGLRRLPARNAGDRALRDIAADPQQHAHRLRHAPRQGDFRHRGLRGRRARLQGEAQAEMEAAVSFGLRGGLRFAQRHPTVCSNIRDIRRVG